MGLLDSVIGAIGQSQGGGGGQPDLLNAVVGMLGHDSGSGGGIGGLAGLVAKMQQGGLGDVAASWIGQGQNQPIAPDQLGGVLGNDMVAKMAQQLGLNSGDLLGQLAQLLPQLVDKLTPHGEVPQGDLGTLLGGLLSGQTGQGGGAGDLAGMLGGLLKR
jgi:uncharacterized protein YidB (DUF937 family)